MKVSINCPIHGEVPFDATPDFFTGEAVTLYCPRCEQKDSLLTQTANAVGRVIGQLQVTHQKVFRLQVDRFDVRDLTPAEFRELKCACANHLSELLPDLAKESVDD